MQMESQHVDVLIVGAGLSGIGAAYHLQTKCPNKTYAILESREGMGGTWDLFRYPGIRSDSDMYTLGYSFRPWTHPEAIADGSSILAYIRDTAERYGIDRAIRYGHKVERLRWSSKEAQWTATVREVATGRSLQFTASFVFSCTGYYDYDGGYEPKFAGSERFRGHIVHPQKWTPDIEYQGKRVVVIGSGATAVTLVPEIAKQAAHVTMLQRSPSYIVSLPERDSVANWLRERLPKRVGVLGDAMEERADRHGVLCALSPLSGGGEEAFGGAGAQAARRSERYREALHAALQPVGPARVPHSRRRSFRRPSRGSCLGRYRSDRDVHGDGDQTAVWAADRCGSGCHRDGFEAQISRRHVVGSRWRDDRGRRRP